MSGNESIMKGIGHAGIEDEGLSGSRKQIQIDGNCGAHKDRNQSPC